MIKDVIVHLFVSHCETSFPYLGEKPQQLRGLKENHNHDRKAIFKSAATMASSREGPFRDFYQGLLTKGMKPAMAAHAGAENCGHHSDDLEERSAFRR